MSLESAKEKPGRKKTKLANGDEKRIILYFSMFICG